MLLAFSCTMSTEKYCKYSKTDVKSALDAINRGHLPLLVRNSMSHEPLSLGKLKAFILKNVKVMALLLC